MEIYLLEHSPKKGNTYHNDRAWMMPFGALKAASLGYVKGSTRSIALHIILAACHTLKISPPAEWLATATHIHVYVRGNDPSVNIMRSLQISHDNVRQMPHGFYWVKAVLMQDMSNVRTYHCLQVHTPTCRLSHVCIHV